MRPSLARLDAADGVFSDTVFRSNFALKARVGADGAYLRFRQFGSGASFPAIRCAVLDAVKLIVSRRVPSQIFQSVVPRIAVVVAALHPNRARPNKGSQHQCMRAHDFLFAITPQIHKRARVVDVFRVSLDSVRFRRTNLPGVRHFVQALKSNNCFPVLHDYPRSADMGIIAHG